MLIINISEIFIPPMDFAFLREFQMERDQLVIKQQNGNICNLQGQPDSFGTDKCPFPQEGSPKSFPAAQLRQREGGRGAASKGRSQKPTPAPPFPLKLNQITGLVRRDIC